MKKLSFLLYLLLASFSTVSARGIYVGSAATGTRAGTSWLNAYTRLDTALTVARADTSVHEVYVAQGTYYTASFQSSTNRDTAMFINRGGLRVYGGYPTGGDVRSLTANWTIVDGNIGSAASATDNSKHVLRVGPLATASDTVIIDGLSFRNSYSDKTGGAVYIYNCSNGAKTIVRNCRISGNQVIGTGTTVATIQWGYGGGMSIMSSSPVIANCLFNGNKGIMTSFVVASTSSTSPCHSCPPGPPVTTYTTYNSGAFGGDIFNSGPGTAPLIVNCTFSGTLSNLSIYNTSASATLTNCIVYGTGNYSSVPGAMGGGSWTVSHSIIQGGFPGTANSASNPLFLSMPSYTLAPFQGGDYHLLPGSPAEDSGTSTGLPPYLTTDIEGAPRIQGAAVNMGAFETTVSQAISGPSSLCVGSSATLSAFPSGGTWSSSNASIATVSSSGTVSALAAGVDTIFYALSTGTARLVLTVNALPVVAAVTGSAGVCKDASITLANTTPGGVWTVSDTTKALVGAGGIVYGNLAGTDTVIYTVTVNGCSSSAIKSISIYPLPVMLPVTGAGAVCPGASITLSNAAAGGVWTSANTSVATVSSSGSVTGIAAGGAGIVYTLTNSFGCSDTAMATVTVKAKPAAATSITGAGAICAGSNTAYTANAGGAFSSSNTAVATIGATSGIVTGIGAGTASIIHTVTNSFGCTATASVSVTVNPLPVPVITRSGAVLSTQAFSAYQWLRNDTLVPGATGASYTPIANGSYRVIVITAAGCSDTSNVYVMGTLGVGTMGAAAIRLFPNPAASVIHIDAPEPVRITLCGMDGRLLMEESNTRELDITALREGCYTITLIGKTGEVLRQKLVKMGQ